MTSSVQGGSGTGAGDSWGAAKKYAASLGAIPSSFSVVIRALINDHLTFGKKMRPVNKYQVARLLKGPSFKIMMYSATKSLRPLAMTGQEAWNLGSMMAAFAPLDLAALIASFVYYRKCKKLAPDQTWKHFTVPLLLDPQFGGVTGSAVDEIGVGSGLLVCSFHHFARCSFGLKPSPAFEKYATQLKGTSLADLIKREEEAFGCNAAQVAVMMLSAAGFGTEISNGVSIGFDPSRPTNTLKDEWALRMRYARIWADEALAGFDQPREKFPAKYFPSVEQHQWLKQMFLLIREGNAGWLQATKADLNAKFAPELFAKPKGLEDIPEALQEVFSISEITSMEEEDFDDLIDQIDDEQASGKHPEVLDGKDLNALEDMVS